ncbi:MAG: potassium channel family protein [Planctomycetota bacterium]
MKKRTDLPRPLPPVLAHSCLGLVITHVLISAYAMEDPTSLIAIVTQAVFYLILAAILFGVQSSRLEFTACVVLIGAATIARVFFAPDEQIVQAAADVALVAVGTLVLIKAVQRMLHTSVVTPALISAAVTVYLLAGVIWTIGFHALETLHPESFVVSGRAAPINAGELSYFSFVTLTTLGYGDVSPATPIARSMATLEAVFGQVFLVVLLGRLVSLHIAQRHPPRIEQPEHAPVTPRKSNE